MNRHRLFSLFAGALDFSTGWGLMLFPATVQDLMLVGDPLPDPSSRIVGAFVAGVGTLYLWCAARPGAGEKRLWNLFAMTAILRGYVGIVFTLLVITGKLGPMWLTVGVTDLALAVVQTLWWKNGRERQT